MDFKVTKCYEGMWEDPEDDCGNIWWRIDEDGDLTCYDSYWDEHRQQHACSFTERRNCLPMQFIRDLVEAIDVGEMLKDMEQGTEGEG